MATRIRTLESLVTTPGGPALPRNVIVTLSDDGRRDVAYHGRARGPCHDTLRPRRPRSALTRSSARTTLRTTTRSWGLNERRTRPDFMSPTG
jgi:hypothetical protein